jgi:hypothetical protein
VEDHPIGLAHHRGQHVQAAAVRHADDDVAHAQRAAALDDLLQRRDHALAAVEAEALGAGEALVQEALEALGLDQLLQDRDLALAGEDDLLVAALDALLQPRFFGRVGDVHVLHADVAAVGAPQDRQDLAQGRGFQPQHIVEEDRPVVVRLGEAVARRIELGGVALGDREAERIEIGAQVAAHPVGADHHDRAQRIEGASAHLVRAGGRRGGGDAGFQLGVERRPDPVDGRQPLRPRLGHRLRRPGRRLGGLGDIGRLVAELLEEGAPGGLDRLGIGRPPPLQVFHKPGVAAVQK